MMIGTLNPSRRMLFASWAIFLFECRRALRRFSLSDVIDTYSI
jgi:hypothetical protein